MIYQLTADRPSARAAKTCARWCAYALVLLTPGSFVIVPALWLIRRFVLSSR